MCKIISLGFQSNQTRILSAGVWEWREIGTDCPDIVFLYCVRYQGEEPGGGRFTCNYMKAGSRKSIIYYINEKLLMINSKDMTK